MHIANLLRALARSYRLRCCQHASYYNSSQEAQLPDGFQDAGYKYGDKNLFAKQ